MVWPMTWALQSEPIHGGVRFRIMQEVGASQEPLSVATWLALLQTDEGFVAWYVSQLAAQAAGMGAFFWEHPPLGRERLQHQAEFVLLGAHALRGLQPDPAPFADQFAAQPQAAVLSFVNLGGDALLVVPSPQGAAVAYAHLADFVCHAPRPQVLGLFQELGRQVEQRLVQGKPIWLSTSGLGVAWVHVRLDRRPKYYQFGPYKRSEV